jgi:ribulose 1,5-bisphosphate synthetase/thiazole synthase
VIFSPRRANRFDIKYLLGLDNTEKLPDDTVLIVGGGPVGLLLANVLAFYGIKSLVLERNNTTTK